MALDVFISYAASDKSAADSICEKLEAAGTHCWIAPRDIRPGANWASAIIRGIEQSKLMVLVFSADSNNSRNVLREVERAVNKGLPIIPVRIEDLAPTQSMEFFLATSHWLDAFTSPFELHLDYLVETVQLLVDGAKEAPPIPGSNDVPVPDSGKLTLGDSLLASRPQVAKGNLPSTFATFLGREHDIGEVKDLLRLGRFVTLTGPGGCGKTRLAVEIGKASLEYPDGVWLTELAPLSDGGFIVQAIASALGIREEQSRALITTVKSYLSPRRLLLILDNCEHLIHSSAAVAEEMLKACPNLTILATSREALGVIGERVWALAPLDVPPLNDSPELIEEFSAVQLFTDRATAANRAFRLTPDNSKAVASICRTLDGIPLAIELAAKLVRALSVQEIANKLTDRFSMLTQGARTASPRQQTLHAAIDWSYELLAEDERQAFRQLSVFASTWTLESGAGCSAGTGEPNRLLDVITRLVDKSLVVVEAGIEGSRYRFLQTIRQFAAEKLALAAEEEGVRERQLSWYLLLASKADGQLRSTDSTLWLQRLESEMENVREILSRNDDDPAAALEKLRLAGLFSRFWSLGGYWAEGRAHIVAALHRCSSPPPDLKAKALYGIGLLAYYESDYESARMTLEQSLNLFEEEGVALGAIDAQVLLGLVSNRQGKYQEAEALLTEGLRRSRQAGDDQRTNAVLNNLGNALERQGDYSRARGLYEESLSIKLRLGDELGAAGSLHNLGVLAARQGDDIGAREFQERAVKVGHKLRNNRLVTVCLLELAALALRSGEYFDARQLFFEAIEPLKDLGDTLRLAECIEGLVQVGEAINWLEGAGRLVGAAESLRSSLNAPMEPGRKAGYERLIGRLRERLGSQQFAAVEASGRRLTVEEALALALSLPRA